MNQGAMDVDPLSTYEYPAYDSYQTSTPYTYNVKIEETVPYYNQNYINQNRPYEPVVNNHHNENTINDSNTNDSKKEEDVKPDIGKKKKNGKSYCSEKITDANFAFYGCSVCNISYTALLELDQHVVIHKNRMTSYRLRLKNQIKKKQMKKEKKKLKKLLKIKKETEPDIEIKPEDGYIGNEKAVEYLNKSVNDTTPITKGIQDAQACPQNNGIVKNDSHNNGSSLSNTCSDNKDKENANDGNVNMDSDSKNNGDTDAMELHNLEKIYKCFACKKQFTLSYYLKLHVRSHTDEKPYTCSVCGQSFITASKLGRHNKRIHLAERYQCRICFKIFSRFDLLTGHFDKNHPEDKLEGEPYDYNAILPYLKELEEQLKNSDGVLKNPEELLDNTSLKDEKPKTEELWWADVDAPRPAVGDDAHTVDQMQTENQKLFLPKPDIEELRLNPEDDVKVKTEVPDDEQLPCDDGMPGDTYDDDDNICDELKNEDPNDGSNSDEDYFPSKTWISSPKMDASPPRRNRKTAELICEICNKRVSSKSYMRVHLRTHTGEKPFKCHQCGRGFITSSKMHRHVITHEEEDGAASKSLDIKPEPEDNPDVDSTEKTKKSSKKKAKTKFPKKSKLDGEKTKKKYQKRPHTCEFCNQKFLHLKMLQVHKKCHEGETLVLKCNFCLIETTDEAALRDHEATHAGPKPYLCTICGKCYKKKETMIYHKKLHKPDREFTCDICSKRFNAACKLQKHMATHRPDKFVLRYECPVCAHMFNTKYHIHMHLATHQKEGLILEENRNQVLAMVLQNARKIPKQPDASANLTDIMPSDERSRICNICGEIFHHFYYLEEHLKSHGSKIAVEDTTKQEEKKYVCNICSKAFKLHYYLKLHTFTHSKEKPFICQQCGKGFITKGKLKRHLETHTGLKKYQCHICCKFFTRPSYLRIHIRTIHGTQDYNFRFDKQFLSMNVLAQVADRSSV